MFATCEIGMGILKAGESILCLRKLCETYDLNEFQLIWHIDPAF